MKNVYFLIFGRRGFLTSPGQRIQILLKSIIILVILSLLTFGPQTAFAQNVPHKVLRAHTDGVSGVVFSPDGSRLASWSNYDSRINLWDGVSGEHIATLSGHTNEVRSVVFSPDGSRLASWSVILDRTVRLWDGVSGEHIATLRGHSSSARSVVFSPDGSRLASWSDDATRLWDGVSGEHIATLEGHSRSVDSVVFSPDGSRLASWGWKYISLWDGVSGDHITTLEEHTDSVYSVVFSPDGSRLASGSRDRTIRLWDGVSGEHITTLEEHSRSVDSVVFSPDGSRLASWSNYDSRINLWDGVSGEHIATLSGHTNEVRSVVFSPDGSRLASWSKDDTIRLWDGVSGEHIVTLRGHGIAFSPDGSILASGSGGWGWDGTIRLWDSVSGDPISTLEGSRGVFSPDGSRLASFSPGWISSLGTRTGVSRIIRLWELPDTRVSITPASVVSPIIGGQFTVNVSIVAGKNVGGYQLSLGYDATAIRYVSSANGDYLPSGAFFVPPVVSDNKVTLGATSLAGISNGDGTLATVTFEVVDPKASVIRLFDVILTDSAGERLPRLTRSGKILEPADVTSSAVISITPSPVVSSTIGELLTLNIDITGGENVAGYNLTVQFDWSVLAYSSSDNGSYLLNASPSVVRQGNLITLSATSRSGVANGDGTLATITFRVQDIEATEVPTVKTSPVSVSTVVLAGGDGLDYIPTFENAQVEVQVKAPIIIIGDVNGDGVVNILDLVRVASKFGQEISGAPEDVNGDGVVNIGAPEDVNGDGVVNIVDLVKVAGALGTGETEAAPSARSLETDGTITREEVQKWLTDARQLNLTDPTSQRGISFLETLLAVLTPKETRLLANYPNPFNPETWIPYQLAKSANVKISIYAADGKLIRMLDLGHQPIGIYESRSRAAYWDGKNALGEPVASGVYFYVLTAGEFTATRKMLILK